MNILVHGSTSDLIPDMSGKQAEGFLISSNCISDYISWHFHIFATFLLGRDKPVCSISGGKGRDLRRTSQILFIERLLAAAKCVRRSAPKSTTIRSQDFVDKNRPRMRLKRVDPEFKFGIGNDNALFSSILIRSLINL